MGLNCALCKSAAHMPSGTMGLFRQCPEAFTRLASCIKIRILLVILINFLKLADADVTAELLKAKRNTRGKSRGVCV